MDGVILILGLGTGNFLYQQMTPTPDYWKAAERTFFQAVAIVLYAYMVHP